MKPVRSRNGLSFVATGLGGIIAAIAAVISLVAVALGSPPEQAQE